MLRPAAVQRLGREGPPRGLLALVRACPWEARGTAVNMEFTNEKVALGGPGLSEARSREWAGRSAVPDADF